MKDFDDDCEYILIPVFSEDDGEFIDYRKEYI